MGVLLMAISGEKRSNESGQYAVAMGLSKLAGYNKPISNFPQPVSHYWRNHERR